VRNEGAEYQNGVERHGCEAPSVLSKIVKRSAVFSVSLRVMMFLLLLLLLLCEVPKAGVLQPACTYPMCAQCSHFHRQEAPRHNDAGDPSSEMCNLLGEKPPVIWPKIASSTLL
jgi:hypothetical protein